MRHRRIQNLQAITQIVQPPPFQVFVDEHSVAVQARMNTTQEVDQLILILEINKPLLRKESDDFLSAKPVEQKTAPE